MSALCASLECVTNFVSVEKQQQHFKRYLSLFLSACLSPYFSLCLSFPFCLFDSLVCACLLFANRNDIYIAGHSYRLSCFVSPTHTHTKRERLLGQRCVCLIYHSNCLSARLCPRSIYRLVKSFAHNFTFSIIQKYILELEQHISRCGRFIKIHAPPAPSAQCFS